MLESNRPLALCEKVLPTIRNRRCVSLLNHCTAFFFSILLLCCYYFKVCGSCETVCTAGVSKLWSRMEMSHLIHYVQWPCYFSFLFSVAVTALFAWGMLFISLRKKERKKNMSIPTKTHNLYVKDGKIWSRYFWSIIDLLYRAVNMRFLLISAVNLGILCKDCVKDASALRSKDDIQFHQHCNGKNSRLESSRWVITESTSNFITMTLNYKKCD